MNICVVGAGATGLVAAMNLSKRAVKFPYLRLRIRWRAGKDRRSRQ